MHNISYQQNQQHNIFISIKIIIIQKLKTRPSILFFFKTTKVFYNNNVESSYNNISSNCCDNKCDDDK